MTAERLPERLGLYSHRAHRQLPPAHGCFHEAQLPPRWREQDRTRHPEGFGRAGGDLPSKAVPDCQQGRHPGVQLDAARMVGSSGLPPDVVAGDREASRDSRGSRKDCAADCPFTHALGGPKTPAQCHLWDPAETRPGEAKDMAPGGLTGAEHGSVGVAERGWSWPRSTGGDPTPIVPSWTGGGVEHMQARCRGRIRAYSALEASGLRHSPSREDPARMVRDAGPIPWATSPASWGTTDIVPAT